MNAIRDLAQLGAACLMLVAFTVCFSGRRTRNWSRSSKPRRWMSAASSESPHLMIHIERFFFVHMSTELPEAGKSHVRVQTDFDDLPYCYSVQISRENTSATAPLSAWLLSHLMSSESPLIHHTVPLPSYITRRQHSDYCWVLYAKRWQHACHRAAVCASMKHKAPSARCASAPQRPLRAQRCIGHAISSIVTPGNAEYGC
jgi:hypothetical protein